MPLPIPKKRRIGVYYRGYAIQRRTKGHQDVDVFYRAKNGELLYQGSASDLSAAIRMVDAMKGD